MTELEQWEWGEALAGDRVRRPGGGRKRVTDTVPELDAALSALVDPVTRGDPESPLVWVAKSTRALAAALREQGYQLSHETVRQWLLQHGFTLQSTRKTTEGKQHPDRNAQFEYWPSRSGSSRRPFTRSGTT
ncbi:MAG: ISAzo13-like element transposase-related protein [Armatimonadota bacterium]